MVSVELADGELVEAEVKRSPRARVTRIQLGADRPLRIIVPDGASDEFAIEALLSKRSWVRRKLDEVARTTSAPDALGLSRPGIVCRHGEAVPIRPAGTRFARLNGGALEVPEDPEVARRAVERWYRREAGGYLRRLVEEEVERLGYGPTAVAIRDQRTRWGSCSAAGRLSLNWRLFLMPEDVARYVVVHELIHLRVPNHSKRFWRTLTATAPGWQRQARWLREHGDELRRYTVDGAVGEEAFEEPVNTDLSD
jgi:predicted metal-dependent hydrolase